MASSVSRKGNNKQHLFSLVGLQLLLYRAQATRPTTKTITIQYRIDMSLPKKEKEGEE